MCWDSNKFQNSHIGSGSYQPQNADLDFLSAYMQQGSYCRSQDSEGESEFEIKEAAPVESLECQPQEAQSQKKSPEAGTISTAGAVR